MVLVWSTPADARKKYWLPEELATVEQAFAPLESLPAVVAAPDGLAAIPSGSYKSATFAVPFEDAYRAVVTSLSQAQLFVEHEEKEVGLILASRTIQARPPVVACAVSQPYNGVPQQRNYYYAVVVTERGPRETDVTVLAKAQGRCKVGHCFKSVDFKDCHAYAEVHWAQGQETTMPEIVQVLTFVRSNLMAAGLL